MPISSVLRGLSGSPSRRGKSTANGRRRAAWLQPRAPTRARRRNARADCRATPRRPRAQRWCACAPLGNAQFVHCIYTRKARKLVTHCRTGCPPSGHRPPHHARRRRRKRPASRRPRLNVQLPRQGWSRRARLRGMEGERTFPCALHTAQTYGVPDRETLVEGRLGST
jgi:hypothetical protein